MPPSDVEIIARAIRDKDNLTSEKDIGSLSTLALLLKKRNVSPVERHVIIKTRDTSQDGIWGIGEWGDGGLWDGTYEEDFEIIRVVNAGRTYVDRFFSTIFRDTANTTAIWTGGGQISLTNSQVAQSISIYLNNETVSTATLSATDGGAITYALSSNGGANWENVTSGTALTFQTPGTDLRWKATASGTSSISYLEVSY